MTSVAVFDLDKTLVRGSSLLHFGWYLARKGVINPMHVARHAAAELEYVRTHTQNADIDGPLAERLLGLVRGQSQDRMQALALRFARGPLHRHLVLEVVEQVMHFRKLGVPMYIATASPQELADAIAWELGMDGAIGTIAQTSAGIYTGRLASPVAHGPAKAERVAALMVERDFDRVKAWAFSDSVNDLPMLVQVGHPVAVNADRRLRQVAELNNWPLLTGEGTGWRLTTRHARMFT